MKFEEVLNINVNDKTEKKNNLTYLSWAWAWREIKKQHPDATYTIYENKDGWNYHTDGRTCWVKTGMMVQGIEHIEYLPVMDYRNASISADKVTSFDVNKAIQRSLTKAAARHGLGLYIYAGEDLPEDEEQKIEPAGKRTITNEVLARGQQIDALIKKYNMSREDYAGIVSATKAKSPADMTADEFSEHLKIVQQRFEAAK